MIILAAILGAILNRFRGSGIPYCRLVNVVVFGLFMGYALGLIYAIPCALAMQVGQSLGWGRYIGALFGTEKEALVEVKWIDVVIRPLRGNMQAWGCAGLALRGAFWSSCIAFATLTPWVAPVGLAMPFFYYAAWMISQNNKNPAGHAWEVGEVLFGAWLWGIVVALT